MIRVLKNLFSSQLYAFSLYARQIAGTLVLFFIARYLSVYDYGIFTSYKSIATFCFIFANLGFADYILVSSKGDQKEVGLKIALFLTNAINITILLCILGYCFNLESNLLFCLVIIRTFFDGTFFALILPYFQATKKFNTIAVINIIYSICILLIAIVSLIFKLSLVKFLLLNICLGLINFIQCSYYAKIKYFLFFTHIKRFVQKIDKSIYAYMGVTITYFLYSKIPSLYVATYINKNQAALFFAADTISNIIFLIIIAQSQKMLPEMIKTSTKNIKNIIKKNLIYVLLVTFAIFIFIVIFGKILLKFLYGQIYYLEAYPVLLILILANICMAEATVFGTYMTASGNQKLKIPIMIETSVITILGLIILHKYGIIGAAISLLFAAMYAGTRFTLTSIKLIKKQENLIYEQEKL